MIVLAIGHNADDILARQQRSASTAFFQGEQRPLCLKRYFVTGATGTVGSRVVKQLLKRAEGMAEKPRIVAGVHSADKAQALSAAGAHIAEIDYDKPGTVEQAFGQDR